MCMQLLKNKPKDFMVLSGDDMIALPMVLAGGSGVISVIAQGFPKEFSEMIRLGLNRKVDDAFKLQYQFSDCIDNDFRTRKSSESNRCSSQWELRKTR